MLTVRTTNLESFDMCPKKFMEAEQNWDDEDILLRMYLGDIGHLSHQNVGVGMKLAEYYFKKLYPNLKGKKDNILEDKFEEILMLISKTMNDIYEYDPVYELKLAAKIEDVFVTGTLDCFLRNLDKKRYEIYDFKIAASSSYYEDKEHRLQPYLYSYLVMEVFNVDYVYFSYLIYEKKSKPDIKRVEFEIYRKDVEKKIKDLVIQYKFAKELGIYEPKKNIFCRGCPFYKDGSCPLYKVEIQ